MNSAKQPPTNPRERPPHVLANDVPQQGVNFATPLIIALALWLFLAGHNQPGGGFAAGLVLGALVALRAAVGLPRPQDAEPLLGGGALITTVVAAAPVLWGRDVLDQVVVSASLPLVGSVKSGSALLLDAGVTLIVLGVVVAVLNGLGGSLFAEDDPLRTGDDDDASGEETAT